MLLIITLSFLHSCNNKQTATNPEPFDKAKWKIKSGDDYPYRDKMYKYLITNDTLKGMKKSELLDFLGAPNRTDSNYLFYEIAQKRLGFFPLHTKTLVIKLVDDSTVEWRKIHE